MQGSVTSLCIMFIGSAVCSCVKYLLFELNLAPRDGFKEALLCNFWIQNSNVMNGR